MTLSVFAVFLVAGSATQAAPPAASPAPPPKPCSAEIHRQFDFWIGEWDVVNAAGKFAGTNRIERVGDCFLQESWASAAGGYTGRSLNSVGSDGKWHQTWTDTGGLRLDLAGGLQDDAMVLEGETPSRDPKNPAPTLNRITWSRLAGGVVRQHWETSTDGGKTWATAFDGMYHPAVLASPLPDGFFRKAGGAWIGTGVVAGRDSHVELRIERGVGPGARLHWRNVMAGEPREVFEGMAVYEPKGATEYAATWWDSQGAKHPIVARSDTNSLTALWGESGRTVYSLLESGELEVVDSVKRPDGAWAEFGRTRLKRE